jgi:glycosyltransferase involved in cell wall biosynthesis
MSDHPLVSFITGTFERPDMIAELIENIREQTYRPLEHCIVMEPSDDPEINSEYRQVIEEKRLDGIPRLGRPDLQGDRYVRIKFVEVGRHWSGFLANSISAVPYQVAQWLSSGAYLCWAADDERFTPDHVEKLVALAEAEQADFVYPLQGCYWRGAVSRHVNWIGLPKPAYGQITHALYRAELLDYRGFEVNVGSGTDWDQVKTWMQAGARWAFLPEKTMTHKVDKAGDAGARLTRQPLRGHDGDVTRAQVFPPTDCRLCGDVTPRECWCHTSSGGSDNKPCRCAVKEQAG